MPRLPALLAGAVLLSIAASPVDAQVPSTPRALGAGGAWMAFSRGQEALYQNPANLGLPGAPRWSVGLGSVVTGGTIAGLDLARISDLVAYGDLSDEERDELFATIPATGVEGDFNLRAPLFTLQVGPVAAGLGYAVMGSHGVSRDLVELFLYGYEEGRTDYDVSATAGARTTFWDLAVAYGESAGPVSFGVTGHYLRGGTLLQSWMREPRIDLIARDIEVGYTAAYVSGGQGYALDLGAAYQPWPSLTLGAAVTNAYSTLDWSDDLRVRDLVLTRADFEDGELQDLLDRYEESERDAGPGDEPALRGVTAAVLQREAHLPTVARFGVGWEPRSGTQLSAAWSESVTDGALEGSWERMAGIGVQQGLVLASVRAGIATNFDGGAIVAGGLSVAGFDLGVARLDGGADEGAGWMLSLGLATRSRLGRGN